MVTFLIVFFIIEIISAIMINGIYTVTRGDWYPNPDSSLTWRGKIFSNFSRVLRQHSISKQFYKGPEFYKKVQVLEKFFTKDLIIEILETSIMVNRMDLKDKARFACFAAQNNLNYTEREYGSGNLISLYEPVKNYSLPMWVTAPLGECITCMSSFWGTLCWLFWYNIIEWARYAYPKNITAEMFVTLPIEFKFMLWIFFCISLSWINEIVFNINNSLKK